MIKKITLIGLFLFLITSSLIFGQGKTINFDKNTAEKKWSIQDFNPELPVDWSTFEYLTFEFKASSTQRFFVDLHDKDGQRQLRILPFQGAWVRASVPLQYFQSRNTKGHDMAAISQKGYIGYGLGFSKKVGTINQIDSLGFSIDKPVGPSTLQLRNIELTMEAKDSVLGPLPLVDEFGQWIPTEWAGKANTLEGLRQAWQKEESELESGRFNYSKYGGYLHTQAKATGFFRVEKIDGKWWFIDPEGHYFYSTGSTGIGIGSAFERIDGREYIFKAFPPDALIESDEKISKGSFTPWNLQRRFGEDWYQKWKDFTIRRMNDWGLNTIANWSDPALGQSHRKAYVATLRNFGIKSGIMGLPDVYDGDFAKMIDESAAKQCAPLKDDPFLLGYFVGNEPAWPSREKELIEEILKKEGSPIQKACKAFLAKGDTPERRTSFVYDTYTKFIKAVNRAIEKHDPNHLNLGLRFGGHPSKEIISASANVGFDVFSMNVYSYSIGKDLLEMIDEYVGLPVVIGEFHFGAIDRGLSPGLKQTTSQEERGVAYRYYVENAVAHPSIIGTHYFQWRDQPAIGRNDGENYNIGLVDVTDRPYGEFIDAARKTHQRIFEIHTGKIRPVTRKALIQQ